MKSKKVHLSRDYFPSFLLIIFGLSLLLVQCSDKFLDSPASKSRTALLPSSQQMINKNHIVPSSLYDIQVPPTWNGDLVVYAHGYVDPQKPLALPEDSIGGQSVASIVMSMGMAYATTSYPHNGLNGPEAVTDLINLVNKFNEDHPKPTHVYLVGVSEGALITTLAVEQHPEVFSGGLAVCGPIGDFRKQLNYFGNFHVLFQYFFHKIKVGTPRFVNKPTIDSWLNGDLKATVSEAVEEDPQTALTLLKVANVPVQNPGNTDELKTTILNLLRYNILATNDAIDRLGGLPFDNTHTFYRGTGSLSEDLLLNKKVKRYTADSEALETINNQFQTSGDLSHPLVTMHTSGDQIIPYWHEPLYTLKVFKEGAALLHSNIPIIGRYGHCNLTLPEMLIGFVLMVYKVNRQDLLVPTTVFASPQQEQEFLDLSKKQGISPKIKRNSKYQFK